ncbi:uncharacterized protein EI97DRAFT_198068 [Westerdykella ornata]|uniref:Mid2 domain-containing protein n=1 Tax=Westerdykella ornata TaxID=318751 RepID=A0A6A6J9A8_WESOR|nr:uncharacterized protein EI97DRAFT_198068 [Westerdykella ornata]KAF2272857.1 hypothetical protein EI97DRAFT_198068 [Westerdykella ornata]
MRSTVFSALLTASHVLLGVSAGPLVERQNGAGTTSSPTPLPTVGLIVSTLSNGEETTVEFFAPPQTDTTSASTTATDAETTPSSTNDAAKSTLTYTPTGLPQPGTQFPRCEKPSTGPFCAPKNEATLYVGKTYYATWDSDQFPLNSTIVVKVQFSNDSSQQVWSSEKTKNSWGYVAVTTEKEWLQGYAMFNLTFSAVMVDEDSGNRKAQSFDGPLITLQNEPPRHLPPPEKNKLHKEGLLIGLPVGLGFVLLVVIGLYIGMRKHRIIGLGNIMGRRNRGYGTHKSRRQRLGLGKKGAIHLEDREVPAHRPGDSLGSLVSNDDDIRPAPRGNNHFRDEIARQKTGR